jgi:zinc/manganese transport system substrate-binding protein
VGAESQYADLIEQIGGQHVDVRAILDNPNVDPHSFEASPSVAKELSQAQLVVQNGMGYDGFMDKLEAANGNKGQQVISAQSVLDLPDGTPNPHLWFDPDHMRSVAGAIAARLSGIDPTHAGDYAKNLAAFREKMTAVTQAVQAFATRHRGAKVAVSEPVADYLLQALQLDVASPWPLQLAIMNGYDPSAQDLASQSELLRNKQVKAYVYNKQVSNSSTSRSLGQAKAAGVPIVAVYEIMPAGYSYEQWMMAEVDALSRALSQGESTQELS